jgi:zinc transport system substrate-binding protein
MKFIKIFLLLLISTRVACAQNNPVIVTSINPIYQIVLAITGDKNNSILIINPNISEHYYQLKKSDVAAVSKADLIFYVDANLEKNFAKLVKEKKSYQLSQVAGIKLLQKRSDPKKLDLHLWMNPENGVKIAEFITQKICEIDATNCQKYQQNLVRFKKEAANSEKIIAAKLAKIKNQNHVFYYDAYQYFEDYFALKPLKIIAQDHDRELSVKDAREFDELAKKSQIKCLFGDVFDEKNSAKKLAQNYKIKFATLDLIGREGGYFELLGKMSDEISGCLE